MGQMLVMFRPGDVESTLGEITERGILDTLYLSWFGGKYDVGNDGVWDTWQIDGPDMLWYYRGEPHIHSYFQIRAAAT